MHFVADNIDILGDFYVAVHVPSALEAMRALLSRMIVYA